MFEIGPSPSSETSRSTRAGVAAGVNPRRPHSTGPHCAESKAASEVVTLEAVVGTDGHVDDVRVLRSHPLLERPAVDAVSQRPYQPLTLIQHRSS